MAEFQIGWLSTGRDPAARELLTTVWNRRRELNAEISFVFCNRGPSETAETAKFFALVGSYHLPLVYFSSRDFQSPGGYERFSPEWRREYDREVMKRLGRFNPDLSVLAGLVCPALRKLRSGSSGCPRS